MPLRKFARAAIIGGAVLAPFAGASAAQAALAGGLPGNATNAPNLLSVKAAANSSVDFCYDRPVVSGGTPGRFSLGGYRSSNFRAGATQANVDPANTSCILAQFANLDYNDYSFGATTAGAVTSTTNQNPSLADSTATLGAPGVSGTAGHTTKPDLISVTADSGNNQAVFTFDQALDTTTTPAAAGFLLYDSAGQPIPGATFVSETRQGNVIIAYTPGTVQNAVKGAVTPAANVQGINDAGTAGARNTQGSAAVAGTSGKVPGPNLVSSSVNAGTNTINFTFDQPVTVGNGNFTAYTSDGTAETGTGATVFNSTSVQVSFPNGQQVDEEYTRVAAAAGAATDQNGTPNVAEGIATGGNAGAQASGYTNAPDAQAVTFDNNTGTVTLSFDQRAQAGTLSSFQLLTATGQPITATPSSVTANNSNSGPGPVQLAVKYTPAQLSAARSIQLLGNQQTGGVAPAVTTFAGGAFAAAGNPTQVISPSASSAKAYINPTFKKHANKLRSKKLRWFKG